MLKQATRSTLKATLTEEMQLNVVLLLPSRPKQQTPLPRANEREQTKSKQTENKISETTGNLLTRE